jgi:hypothetical protein
LIVQKGATVDRCAGAAEKDYDFANNCGCNKRKGVEKGENVPGFK